MNIDLLSILLVGGKAHDLTNNCTCGCVCLGTGTSYKEIAIVIKRRDIVSS